MIISNLTPIIQNVKIHGISNKVNLRWLNELTFEEMMMSPEKYRQENIEGISTDNSIIELNFLPFSTARLVFLKEEK